MDPLNKQERTEAFIKMLAVFILAVVIVAIPMYYAFQLPAKEKTVKHEMSEDTKNLLDASMQNDLAFLNKSDSALALYREFSGEKDKINRDKIQLRFSGISNEMEDYSKTITNDTVKPRLFGNMVFSFNELFSKENEVYALEEILEKAEEGAGGGLGSKEDTRPLQVRQIELIKKALEKNSGSKKNAAKDLGMTERVFGMLLKEYKL